jgi:SpoVK/Ycf46/Vps4 family AAA+-type ATPase
MPGIEERTQIWKLQIHPTKTPLEADVDFQRLAERYVVSGGDIKNAVLKAAAAAASETGPDFGKQIEQRHFEAAMEEVISARAVMQQSVFMESHIAASYPISNSNATLENPEVRCLSSMKKKNKDAGDLSPATVALTLPFILFRNRHRDYDA